LSELGAEIAIAKAKAASGVAISDVRYAAVYDSFTITLAMLLEDLGLAGRGEAAARVRHRCCARLRCVTSRVPATST